MSRLLLPRLTLVLAIVLGASSAYAWEGATTHAGLAEQAAFASRLQAALVAMGFADGLFEAMAVPPDDAPVLVDLLRRRSPLAGGVPDRKGRMAAWAWLAGGAAIADVIEGAGGQPAGHLHVLSPTQASQADAVAWVFAPANPLSVGGFVAQYQLAWVAASPEARARHMAGALVAAGGVLHVLGDMATPSHVRGDAAARRELLNDADGNDRGDRLARLAALTFGRLGIPAPSYAVSRATIRAHFTSADGKGLADFTRAHFFSPNTLPRAASLTAAPRLALPAPKLPAQLNLTMANRPEGAMLRGIGGTCLATYRAQASQLSFAMDDGCLAAQAQVLLAEAAAFEAGLLNYMLGPTLQVQRVGAGIEVRLPEAMGPGTLIVLVEDAQGMRKERERKPLPAQAGGVLAQLDDPGGKAVVVVYAGVNTEGEPRVAAGRWVR